MSIVRSFRVRLAVRFSVIATILALTTSVTAYAALRYVLYERLDTVLRRLAEIEASATTDSPDETVHFHDAMYMTADSSNGAVLTRYAQIWTLDGRPVTRTANLGERTLPLPGAVRERAAATTQAVLFTFEWEGLTYRSYVYPLVLVGEQHRPHLLQVAASTEETQLVLTNAVRILVLLVVFGMGAGAFAGWWVAGYAVEPVVTITRQAEAFEASSPSHRIVAASDTQELRRLVSVLNSMLRRIDDTLGAQRRFLADAGHSIKTPLTILRGDIEVARRRPRTPHEYEQVLDQALRDLKGVSSLAEDLITLARRDGGELKPDTQRIDIADFVRDVVAKFDATAARAGHTMAFHVRGRPVVAGDRAMLERAIGNVIDNALRYGQAGAGVTVSVGESGDDRKVSIDICDRGPGIPEQEIPALFERFSRGEIGRRLSVGFGLGLPIARAIVESHGGTITISSKPGHGTTVRLTLPTS